jgi:hypothetical protein
MGLARHFIKTYFFGSGLGFVTCCAFSRGYLASQANPRLIEVDIEHLPSEKDSKRTGSYHRKNLIVISGGTFSIAFRISSVAFVSLSVSMLMPIPQPAQVICALALSRPMVCLSSCPQLGH